VTKDDVQEMLDEQWGKGFEVTVRETITKAGWHCTVVFYKVKCLRDGMVEWRCKGWGGASAGWDCVTRRKW
jgi:hypothetical protein